METRVRVSELQRVPSHVQETAISPLGHAAFVASVILIELILFCGLFWLAWSVA